MAFQHLIRRALLPPVSIYHQSARPSVQYLLPASSIPPVNLYHTNSEEFIKKILHLPTSFQQGRYDCYDHLTTKSKPYHAVPFHTGNVFVSQQLNGNNLNRVCSKWSTATTEYTSTRGFFTSALKFTAVEPNNTDDVKNMKKSLFHFLSLKSLISTPTPFMLYGISGLIPFMSVPIYMFMTSTYCSSLAHVQLVYGACILSFLGGVAWGKDLATPQQANLKSLGYSIFLPLVGWVGVLMYPSITAFPIVMSGIAMAGYVDTQIMDYSQWFKNLRFLLSLLVFVSLFGTFVQSIGKDRKKKES